MEGTPIGQALYEMNTGSGRHFTINIDKLSDTDLASRVKDIIKKMIVYKPADRISMNEVVARLSEIRDSLPSDDRLSEIRDSLPSDEVLLAVDVRSVWVRVGTVREKQADRLPAEHPDYCISFCAVPDGIVAI